jgi:uncharacterized protein (UPF0276 family)
VESLVVAERARRCGIGLRVRHYRELLEGARELGWAEAITENFLGRGGRPRAVLERVRRDTPVILHGVSLSIGGTEPLHRGYLEALRELADRIEPALLSDHLCFGTFGGHYAHDLWPLPYTEEALEHVARRVAIAQEALGRRILLENVSSYVEYRTSVMPEWEFLSAVAERADCLILLDVNNVWVSARNHGFSPDDYLAGLPRARVAQFHLAGHADCGAFLLDNHGSQVPECVWGLYRKAVRRFGPLPAIVEWDDAVPELDRLLREAETAERIQREVLAA